jgi:hypothetical protein
VKNRPHIRLDACFMDDPTIVAVGEKAAWLYLAMALDARKHQTDGLIPHHRLDRLGVNGWRPRLDQLAAAGLAIDTPDGWLLPGYVKWNRSQREYQAKSHEARIKSCQRWHDQPCRAEECRESSAWLDHNTMH